MRYMPTIIHGLRGETIELPTISRTEFRNRLEEIGQRKLTDEELRRVEKMSDHNWTLRVQAEELFGEVVVSSFFRSGSKL